MEQNTFQPTNERIYYVNPGTKLQLSTKPIEAPGSDISYESWSVLTQCDLVILTVNCCDNSACITQLERALGWYFSGFLVMYMWIY